MKALAKIKQTVEIEEHDLGVALRDFLLKKHKTLWGLLSHNQQFLKISSPDGNLIEFNTDWEKENPEDAILVKAANILIQRHE